jgi:amidohydrolase
MSTMSILEKIQSLAANLQPQWISYRRHLHQNPELSFKEFNTSAWVQEVLKTEGISFDAGWVKTGITATIEGKNPQSRQISLRGDMDALPIIEKNQVEYKSQVDGVMHACGHDVHTTCALGAAIILHRLKDEWEGTVQIIFQPGEEVLPGGANEMIKAGIFNHYKPKNIFGQHVYPELPAGKVGFKPGWYMASTDELYFTVKGKGGHGAKPNQCIDPIVAASQLVLQLQTVVSRNAEPATPSVLTIGKFIANGATNIIPDAATLEGTFRTFDEKWRYQAHERIREICSGIAKATQTEIDVDIRVGYPALFNDEETTERAIALAKEYLGEENVVPLNLRTTAEDFAYFAQHTPSCFYRLGTASADGQSFNAPVHNNQFDINEDALITGVGLMAYLGAKG